MATRIASAAQLRELSAQLRAGKHSVITQAYRKAIRDAGKPVSDEVRNAVLSLSITGSQGAHGVLAPTRGGGRRSRAEFAVQRTRTETGAARARSSAGLRQTVAAAVRVRILARGVTIEVNRQRMPVGQENLPRDLESHKGWDHPTFGDWSKKAHERGGPWFYPTVRRNQPKFAAAITSAHDDARRKLAEKVGSLR